ncbi:unnamed protein product, partial [Allacma fusca]
SVGCCILDDAFIGTQKIYYWKSGKQPDGFTNCTIY